MCSPTATLALQGASAINSTVGSFYAASGQKAALGLQADLSEISAKSALVAGQRDEQRSRLNTAQVKGAQRAAMAANGVDLGSDTPNRVLTSTDLVGEVDAQTIASNALHAAWGYRTQGAQSRAAASAISPGTSALTTLMGGASQVASSWYSMNKAGAFDPKPVPYTGVW
jgi:hypothetical protein